jgi:hypothetical protein
VFLDRTFGSSTSLNEYGSLHAAGFRAVTSNDLVFLYVPLADFPAPVGAKPGTLSGSGQRDSAPSIEIKTQAAQACPVATFS